VNQVVHQKGTLKALQVKIFQKVQAHQKESANLPPQRTSLNRQAHQKETLQVNLRVQSNLAKALAVASNLAKVHQVTISPNLAHQVKTLAKAVALQNSLAKVHQVRISANLVPVRTLASLALRAKE